MRYLKKINKGLILTVIVLLILIIYLVAVEVGRNADKPDIEKACKEYVALLDKYAIMPEDVQKLYGAEDIGKQENIRADTINSINSQMTKLENELKDKMIENDTAIKMQKDTVSTYVKNANDVFQSVVTSYEREITKIKKLAFDEDQVTVTLDTKIMQDIKYLDSTEEGTQELSKKHDFKPQGDTITLKKINGTWKVVYAALTYQDYSMGSGMSVTTISL